MRHRHNGYVYSLRVPRSPWVALLGIAALVAVGSVLLALIVALLAVAATAAVLFGGAWLAWQGTRLLTTSRRPSAAKRATREARGLLEIAATPDPMEQYLLAVREFERISQAALEVEPETAGRGKAARRIWDLADQAENLSDAIGSVERRLIVDDSADGARAHVWELSLAAREVEHYLELLSRVRHAPTLAEMRALVAARASLRTRRAALVDRLDAVQVRRALV